MAETEEGYSYSQYVKNRLKVEYGIEHNPELVEEYRKDLDEMSQTIKKLIETGELPPQSPGEIRQYVN